MRISVATRATAPSAAIGAAVLRVVRDPEGIAARAGMVHGATALVARAVAAVVVAAPVAVPNVTGVMHPAASPRPGCPIST